MDKWLIEIKLSVWAIFPVILAWLSFIIWQYFKKSSKVPYEITEMEITYEIGGQEIKYKVERNFINLEIAHRIYIELITRKAAIEIDENHDVIEEVYDSWYSLFQITREEIKKLSGDTLVKNEYSDDLIRIAVDVLNKGLRPHLTEYQARYRRWYSLILEKPDNSLRNLQDIQREYPDYENLIKSMKEVNSILMNYALQLRRFINRDAK